MKTRKKSHIDKVVSLSETLESFSATQDLYVLFIDLCDSTAIKQFCIDNEIPDSVWIARLQIVLARTAKIIKRYGGAIIKTIGDEIMATFPLNTKPDDIVYCCLEVFNVFSDLNIYNKGKFKVNLKASIDFGSCYDGCITDYSVFDPIGPCVDRCARISKKASANSVVFSVDFYNALQQTNSSFLQNNLERDSEIMKGLGVVEYFKITAN